MDPGENPEEVQQPFDVEPRDESGGANTLHGLLNKSPWPITGTYMEELDLSENDIRTESKAKMCVSTVLNNARIGKLCLPINDKFVKVLRDAIYASHHHIEIEELDISDNDKFGTDEESSMMYLGDVIKKCSIKKLAMRNNMLNCLHMNALKKSLDGYMLSELDISRSCVMSPENRRHSLSVVKPNVPTLGDGATVLAMPEVTPILPNITDKLCMNNWVLLKEECEYLEKFLNSRSILSAPIITYGQHGNQTLQKTFEFSKIRKMVGHDGAEIRFGDNVLLVPSLKEKTQITVHSYMDFSSLDNGYYPVSPIIECGPTGIKFKNPAKLKIKTWLKKGRDVKETQECIKVVWRKSKGFDWQEADDWKVEAENWKARDGVVVTLPTKHFTDFRVLVNKWFLNLILLECNIFHNPSGNIAPVFYVRDSNLRSEIEADLKKNNRSPILPISKIFEAHLDDEITCKIQADGFRFSNKEEILMEFSTKSLSSSKSISKNYTIDEASQKTPKHIKLKCIIDVKATDGRIDSVLDEVVQCDWPLRNMQKSSGDDKQATLFNIYGNVNEVKITDSNLTAVAGDNAQLGQKEDDVKHSNDLMPETEPNTKKEIHPNLAMAPSSSSDALPVALSTESSESDSSHVSQPPRAPHPARNPDLFRQAIGLLGGVFGQYYLPAEFQCLFPRR